MGWGLGSSGPKQITGTREVLNYLKSEDCIFIYQWCSVFHSINCINPGYCQLIYEDTPLGKGLWQLLISHWFLQPQVNIKSPLAYISEQIADLKLRSLGSKKRADENTSVLVGRLCLILDAPFFFNPSYFLLVHVYCAL